MSNVLQFVRAPHQPIITKMRAEADGIEVWHNRIHKAGTILPQHSHCFPHLTVIAQGSVRVILDNEVKGEFAAPSCLIIPAGQAHTFVTLEDNTVLECIHNVTRTGKIEIAGDNPFWSDK